MLWVLKRTVYVLGRSAEELSFSMSAFIEVCLSSKVLNPAVPPAYDIVRKSTRGVTLVTGYIAHKLLQCLP